MMCWNPQSIRVNGMGTHIPSTLRSWITVFFRNLGNLEDIAIDIFSPNRYPNFIEG